MIREYVLSVKGSNGDIQEKHSERYEELTRVMEKFRANGDSIRLDYADRPDGEKHKRMFGDYFALAKEEFRKAMEDAKKEMDERYP